MNKSILKTLLIGVPLSIGFSSCVTDEYELTEDNLSMDVQFGGNLTLPLGNGEKTVLGDLIEENEQIQTQPDGKYIISQVGNIDETHFSIDPVTVTIDKTEAKGELDFEEIPLPDLPDIDISSNKEQSATINEETKFVIREEVDPALKSVREVSFTDDVKVTIRISVNNLPQGIDRVELSDFKIDIPQFLQFENDPELDADNNLIINAALSKDGTYTKILNAQKFSFDYLSDHKLDLINENGKNIFTLPVDESKITFDGDIKLPESTVHIDDLQGIGYQLDFIIEPIEFKEIKGQVDPVIDPIRESVEIELGEDADFLKEEGTQLQISNPTILLEVNNTVNLSVDAKLSIWSTDRSGNDICQPIKQNIKIKGADINGVVTTTKLLLSKKPTQRAGYENVVIPELDQLLNKIPDYVNISLDAKADQNVEHSADLTQQMSISGKYEVEVPLDFDNITINYTETIEDLQEDLSDFTENLTKATMEIKSTIINTVPVNMQLTVKAVDFNGNEIPDFHAEVPQTIKANGNTDIIIKLLTKNGAMKNLDKLLFTVKATASSTEGDISLNKDQYLQFTNMSIKIIDELILDLNDDDDDDDYYDDDDDDDDYFGYDTYKN